MSETTLKTADVAVFVPLVRIVIERGFNIRDTIDKTSDRFLALQASIHARPGLEHPIVLRPIRDGMFSIVSGHRRFLAYVALHEAAETDTERAFFEAIPAFVRNLDDRQAAIANATENLAREQLKPYQIAVHAIRVRETFSMTLKEIAKGYGLGHATLTTYVMLEEKLCPRLRRIFHGEHADEETLTLTDLTSLALIHDHDDQEQAYDALLAQRDAVNQLAAKKGLITFGSEVTDPRERAVPTKHRPKLRFDEAQVALLAWKHITAIRIDGWEDSVTDADRQKIRSLLRWVMGLDRANPLVIKVPKESTES
jgi:ParB/RepB/Spo0J family partition protein